MRLALYTLILIFITNFAYAKSNLLAPLVGIGKVGVLDIFKDSKGYVWIGTEDGLALYDGVEVRNVLGPDNSFKNLSVQSIFEDQDGAIWVSLFNGGTYKLNRANSKFERLSVKNAQNCDLDFYSLKSANISSEGLWLGYQHCLYLYDKSKNLRFIKNIQSELGTSVIGKLLSLDQKLLIKTTSGMYFFDKESLNVQKVNMKINVGEDPYQRSFEWNFIKNFYVFAGNQLAIATTDGLYIAKISDVNSLNETNSELHVNIIAKGLTVYDVIEKDSFYWLASHQGLYKLEKETDIKSRNLIKEFGYSDRLTHFANDIVYRFTELSNGDLLLSTSHMGVLRYSLSGPKVEFYNAFNKKENELANNVVWRAVEDSQKNLWFSTFKTIERVNSETGESSIVHGFNSREWGGRLQSVNDDIWFITDSDVYKANHYDLSVEKVEIPEGIRSKFLGYLIDFVVVDEKLLLLTRKGVFFYSPLTKQIDTLKLYESESDSQRWLEFLGRDEDDSDKLLFSAKTDKNAMVLTYSKSTGEVTALHTLYSADLASNKESYPSALTTTESYIWISYPGVGLYVLDRKTKEQVRILTTLDGLPTDNVFDLEKSNEGIVWLTTNKGLVQIEPTRFIVSVYTTDDFLIHNEILENSLTKTKSGDLVIGGMQGALRFEPSHLAPNFDTVMPSPKLSNISLLSNPEKNFDDAFAYDGSNSIAVDYDDVGLELTFSVMDFDKRTKYIFEFDKEYGHSISEVRNGRVRFQDLPTGEHILKVTALDAASNKKSPPLLFNLTVNPPFYLTWWAYSIYLLVAVSILMFIHWLRNTKKQAISDAQRLEIARSELAVSLDRQKEVEAKLVQMANYDSLTGLPNRGLLHDRLEQAIHRAKRQANQFAVCFIDLDGFKSVNDSYGHEAGDKLLIQIADLLTDVVREQDTVARLGGDEFVLLLEQLDSLDAVTRVCETVIEKMTEVTHVEEHPIEVSPSIGIAMYPINGADTSELLKRADIAMYESKKKGKNQYTYTEAKIA